MRRANQIVDEAKLRRSSFVKEFQREHKENHFDLIDKAPDIIFVIDSKGNFLLVNEATQKITGYPLSELLKIDLAKILAAEYHDSIKKILQNTRKETHIPLFETEIINSKGKRIPLEIHLKSIKNKNRNFIAFQGIARDITNHKKIRESEEKYRGLVSNIKIGILRATPSGEILEANPTAVEMFDYKDTEEFLTLKTTDLYQAPEDHEKFILEMEVNSTVKRKEFVYRTRKGTTFWASIIATAIRNRSGRIIYYDTVIEDITARKKLEDTIKRLSITDELTGLYNRRYFNEHLPLEIKEAESWRSSLSLIMIDVDDFKQYNDIYLHLGGDEVLKETARVIATNIRKEEDWASRFGGDEFCIIMRGRKVTEALIVAERIKRIFQNVTFKPKGKTVRKTLSMGIANCFFPEGKLTGHTRSKRPLINYEKIANDLTILSDKALFRAKELGKNQVVVSQKPLIFKRDANQSNSKR